MALSDELIQLREKAIPKAVFQTSQCVMDHAKGSTIVDVDGNEWIDFSGGIGVVNAGHCPDKVVDAVKAQAEKFLHACFHVSMYEGYIKLADKLNRITPGSFEKKTFFTNSGAEAVDNSIKIARNFTKRSAILCFENAFHGRTLAALSVTSKIMPYKAGFGPFLPEVYRVPFPYAYRMADGDQKKANKMVIETIKTAFTGQVDPANVAAVIFEPILGEGGFIPADTDFFKALKELTSQYSILMICDEIQTGFGRTGSLFASEQLGIEYDILLSAKSIASGLPISAITGKADIMDTPQVGGLGGTYGGNPLSCAAALASIDMFENEDLLSAAKKTGQIIKEAFNRFKDRFKCVGDVRGLGAMMAFEIVKDRKTKDPAPELTRKLISFCHSNYLSIITAGTSGNVVRVLSPLNIEEDKLKKGLSIIEEGLATL